MAPQSNRKWGHEATKTLVALYELQPTLYKTTAPSYHNKVLRLKAAEHIMNELNTMYKTSFTAEDVAKKLNNLRTQFMEVHRSCNSKLVLHSGMDTDEVPQPTWWLYEPLQFLLPYCKKDKGKSNFSKAQPEEGPYSQVASPQAEDIADIENTVSVCDETPSVDGEFVVDNNGVLSPISVASTSSGGSFDKKQQTPKKTPATKRKREETSVNSLIADAVQQIANEKPLLPPDVESLSNFIGHELLSFKKKSSLKKCKWELLKVIRELQEAEESENSS